jgi:hypothetical protein
VKNHGHGTYSGQVSYNIKSSGFTVSGISGTVYLGDQANSDLETGSVFLFKLDSDTQPVIVKRNIGTIDYKKGEIKLNPINIISTRVVKNGSSFVEISASPYSNDVIGLQDLYLQLDNSNVVVNVIQDNISSGNDISGSNYKVSSSYANGSLVRGTPVLVTTDTNTTSGTTVNSSSSSATSSNTGSSGSNYSY